MAKIVDAKYHSCWDSGIDVATNCRVNLLTKEVFDIEVANVDGFDLEILEGEWVEIDGHQFVVFPQSELEPNSNSFWRKD